MVIIFLKGIFVGLCLSLPFGPIGIYCMEKTITETKESGYAAAMGMVTVDFIYGITAFLFVNVVKDEIHRYGPLLSAVIALFLCYIGAKKYFREVQMAHPKEKGDKIVQNYLSTFLFAIANVGTIISIVGIYTVTNRFLKVPMAILRSFDISHSFKVYGALIFASGIFIGGAALWLITTLILDHWKRQITHEVIIKITKYAGLIIFVFGVILLISSILKLF